MTTNHLCHPDDARIIRYENGAADLVDADGEILRSFLPYSTDEAIRTALRFANDAYAAGFQAGGEIRAARIRAALGIST